MGTFKNIKYKKWDKKSKLILSAFIIVKYNC